MRTVAIYACLGALQFAICLLPSRHNRYCGATKGLVYSVAEHSVRCADAALRDECDAELAAYLLCHDMHEAYLGDDTTPKAAAERNAKTDQALG